MLLSSKGAMAFAVSAYLPGGEAKPDAVVLARRLIAPQSTEVVWSEVTPVHGPGLFLGGRFGRTTDSIFSE
jgi:hypothetical protein